MATTVSRSSTLFTALWDIWIPIRSRLYVDALGRFDLLESILRISANAISL
jgi:hypothetical protein